MKNPVRALLLLLSLVAPSAATAATDTHDPFLWLEDVGGARAMDWVRAHDAKTLSTLQADPHYAAFEAQALAIAQARDRIPKPVQIGGLIYNLWQDSDHVRGLWRRTTPDDYRQEKPAWTTVIDVDALAAKEHANLVFKGADCLEPEERLCLISFSDGGEDAVSVREFDLSTNSFVVGGFTLPRAKLSVDWIDANTIMVATDWGAGSMTTSGYPFIVKTLKRGQALREAAFMFRGEQGDVHVEPSALIDGQGHRMLMVERATDFFHSEFYRMTQTGPALLPLPRQASVHGLLENRLIVKTEEDIRNTSIKAGSLVSYDMAHLDAPPVSLFSPNARQSVEDAVVTKTRVVASIYDNVRGRAYAFAPQDSGWSITRLALPDNETIDITSASIGGNQVFLDVTGFLDPSTLFLAEIGTKSNPTPVKTTPARFDASGSVVDQHEVASADGTMIPYFVVRPKSMAANGENPTLLYAYGGFQISELPSYRPALGKLWIERGGVYVVANIRGGGEFGPAWHEAALKTNRQRAYDDFAAVARDLIARKITQPRRLGIEGGSNGGLLMGVEFEQHPELWRAVVIEVPLLDMLRFEQIAAGASWTGEYGTVANPKERAFLAGISPYHNLKQGAQYPEPFIFTTTKDDRVGPTHARKFAARMEAMGLPFLYYEATEGGHGAGVNAREIAQEEALEMTYLTRKLME